MKPVLHRPHSLLLGAVFAGICFCAAPAKAADCPPICIVTNSVKNAAGIDPNLIAKLGFDRGHTVINAATPAVADVAQAWKAAGGKGVVSLKVSADAGLAGAAASTQAKARAAALTKALVGAGIPANKVQVVVR